MIVDVVIPALNEAASIAQVVKAIPRPPVRSIYVVDNGSTDATAALAREAGASVVSEPRRGYGSACLAGIAALPADVEVVLFMDADGSDDLGAVRKLLAEIDAGAELVVGSRARSPPGVLTGPQRAGNAIAARWLRMRFGLPATDLGPFRAIRKAALDRLAMADRGYGWTVEMQIKAARQHLRYSEVEVAALPRIAGTSKVSGTVRGVLGATVKILGLLARYDVEPALTSVLRRLGGRSSERS